MQQKETETGYIVYVDKLTNTIHHQDPNLRQILRKLSVGYDHIKYVTYRCSAKLIRLTEALFSKRRLEIYFKNWK